MFQVISFPPEIGSSNLEVVQKEHRFMETFSDDSCTLNLEFVDFLRTSEVQGVNEKEPDVV